MLETPVHNFDSLCSRHQPGEISFQSAASLKCNRISPNIYSVLRAFCPLWQEKALLIAGLLNKGIPQRVFAENLQRPTDSGCDACSFLSSRAVCRQEAAEEKVRFVENRPAPETHTAVQHMAQS